MSEILDADKREQRLGEYYQTIIDLSNEELLASMVAGALKSVRYENQRLPIPPGPDELRGTAIGVLIEKLRRAKLLLDPCDR